MKTKDLIICSLFSAITVLLAQISIPLPGGVPLTFQTLAVALAGILLGAKRGFISIFIYILLGAIGLPVFANFTGGFQIILGPTGGFIISFPIMALIIGLITEKNSKKSSLFIAIVIAALVNYSIGVLFFVLVTKSTIATAVLACVAPFIILDLIKALLATTVGIIVKERLNLRGILN